MCVCAKRGRVPHPGGCARGRETNAMKTHTQKKIETQRLITTSRVCESKGNAVTSSVVMRSARTSTRQSTRPSSRTSM